MPLGAAAAAAAAATLGPQAKGQREVNGAEAGKGSPKLRTRPRLASSCYNVYWPRGEPQRRSSFRQTTVNIKHTKSATLHGGSVAAARRPQQQRRCSHQTPNRVNPYARYFSACLKCGPLGPFTSNEILPISPPSAFFGPPVRGKRSSGVTRYM